MATEGKEVPEEPVQIVHVLRGTVAEAAPEESEGKAAREAKEVWGATEVMVGVLT